jgi:hypothetical protein
MQSIPKTVAPFFQEYNFSTLDVQTHAALIIERILAYGNRVEVRWLFDVYGIETIRAWVERNGERLLPQRRFELWRMLLGIPVLRIAERRQAWPY